MVQVDPPSPRLRRAGLTAADIDYEDDQGRFADFHALRHTFIFPLRSASYAGQANLARAGRP